MQVCCDFPRKSSIYDGFIGFRELHSVRQNNPSRRKSSSLDAFLLSSNTPSELEAKKWNDRSSESARKHFGSDANHNVPPESRIAAQMATRKREVQISRYTTGQI